MKTIKALNLDKIGITASTACAIHCALLPFVLTLLPFLGLEFLAHPAIEISMILLSLIIGAWSLSKSYRKIHHQILPIIILILGFALIFIGHFSGIEILEPIFIPAGGLAIACAHFWNIRLSKSCTH
ncbi:MerC mercury resistance protein [Pedobacter psychrotolerans]|uniref:MerC mercury resistance protein n=1 Tax=Pedobacter psychrotolerans TaxID=1843235 RepID=A0A4R2H407_9SPHI|nr:MerC domain-containing protein [Pedobacter psychrotolerans]TCO19843.1 MerC mercury resistance protein [Pedobacter psychrotolerans]